MADYPRGYAEVTLNGCCCEGGGARGLVQAGHYVVGVDTDPSCREGFLRAVGEHGEFVCADIREVLADTSFCSRFTFGDFGPPCQRDSRMTNCRPDLAAAYPDLIGPVQRLLDANWGGRPYVIENPDNAGTRRKLRSPVVMCMWMFGRPGYRHRLLEAGGGLMLFPPVMQPGCTDDVKPDRNCGWPHPVAAAKAGHWTPGKFV